MFYRYVHPPGKGNLRAQVEVAEICCQLAEQMLELGEELWVVPESIVREIRRVNEEERYRRYSYYEITMKNEIIFCGQMFVVFLNKYLI
jgi:hypothetical protein